MSCLDIPVTPSFPSLLTHRETFIKDGILFRMKSRLFYFLSFLPVSVCLSLSLNVFFSMIFQQQVKNQWMTPESGQRKEKEIKAGMSCQVRNECLYVSGDDDTTSTKWSKREEKRQSYSTCDVEMEWNAEDTKDSTGGGRKEGRQSLSSCLSLVLLLVVVASQEKRERGNKPEGKVRKAFRSFPVHPILCLICVYASCFHLEQHSLQHNPHKHSFSPRFSFLSFCSLILVLQEKTSWRQQQAKQNQGEKQGKIFWSFPETAWPSLSLSFLLTSFAAPQEKERI